MKKLNAKEVSALRGRLKARKRADTMAKRHEKRLADEDRKYQEKLAKDMKLHL